LTRNHHGSNFLDRGKDFYNGNERKLYEAAKIYGEVNLYVGDDGKIYC
jgi:hypothetical protein